MLVTAGREKGYTVRYPRKQGPSAHRGRQASSIAGTARVKVGWRVRLTQLAQLAGAFHSRVFRAAAQRNRTRHHERSRPQARGGGGRTTGRSRR